jgi:hypothetical protein
MTVADDDDADADASTAAEGWTTDTAAADEPIASEAARRDVDLMMIYWYCLMRWGQEATVCAIRSCAKFDFVSGALCFKSLTK